MPESNTPADRVQEFLDRHLERMREANATNVIANYVPEQLTAFDLTELLQELRLHKAAVDAVLAMGRAAIPAENDGEAVGWNTFRTRARDLIASRIPGLEV